MKKLLHFIQSRNYNRINLIKTIWINLITFPFRKAIHFPIIVYGKCVIDIHVGKIEIYGNMKKGMVKIGLSDPIRSYGDMTVLIIRGLLIFKGDAILRKGTRINVDKNASIIIGSGVFISDNCLMISKRNISIGASSTIGNNTQIIDTDFHYMVNTRNGKIHNNAKEIIIGEHNWIGSWCFIKKGARTPEYTIVAGPYSLINKDYTTFIPSYSILAGIPAFIKKTNYSLIEDKTYEAQLNNYFEKNANEELIDDHMLNRTYAIR